MDILILHNQKDRESADSLFTDFKNSGGYLIGIQSYESFDEIDLGVGLINVLFIDNIPITSDIIEDINRQIDSEVVEELFNQKSVLVFAYVEENDTFYQLHKAEDNIVEVYDVYDYDEFIQRVDSYIGINEQSASQYSQKISHPDEELEGLSPNEAAFVKKIAQNKLRSSKSKSTSPFGNKFKML